MTVRVTASPHAAITTVLRSVHLRPGPSNDFTVHQVKQRGKVTGIRVYLQNLGAEETVAETAAVIEARSDDLGFPFRVTTHTTRSGQTLSDIWHEVQP